MGSYKVQRRRNYIQNVSFFSLSLFFLHRISPCSVLQMAWPCLKWERREEPRDMSVIHKRGEACLICAPSSEFLGGRRAPSTRICWEDQENFFGAWQSADDRAQDQPILLSPEAAAARVPKPTFGIELWTKMMDSFLSLSHFARPATSHQQSFWSSPFSSRSFTSAFSPPSAMWTAGPPLFFPSTTTTTTKAGQGEGGKIPIETLIAPLTSEVDGLPGCAH